jgi:CRP-like cAMP-binding protein
VLNRLSTAEYKRVEPHLERVPLNFGETIYKSKAKIDHIYFPDNGVISIVGITTNEKPIEVGLIGAEGFVGLPVFLGVPRSGNHVIVQGEGTAQRISAKAALSEFTRFGAFHDAVLLFAHELFLQLSQITSCNRHHAVEQRLSRWLLMMRDRVNDDTLPLTQEFLSWMLGVRNQAVSQAAQGLQDQGAIKYSRGVLTILNRRTLEKKACPCYRMIRMRTNGRSGAGTAPLPA